MYNKSKPLVFNPNVKPGMMKPESKCTSFNQNSTLFASSLQCNNTPDFAVLNEIRTGSGFNERIGNKILLKSLKIRMNLAFRVPPVIILDSPVDIGRILVVYDRNPQGVLPPFGTIVQDTTQINGNSSNVSAGPNINNRARFTILRDHYFNIPAISMGSGSPVPRNMHPDVEVGTKGWMFEFYIPLKGYEECFIGPDPDIGSIGQGAIYLITMAGLASGFENVFYPAYHWRLRYWDP